MIRGGDDPIHISARLVDEEILVILTSLGERTRRGHVLGRVLKPDSERLQGPCLQNPIA